jgi:hypothetical protein
MQHQDIDALRDALAERAGELAEHLLGEPSWRGRAEWRWGRKGSFSLAVSGPKRGQWFDHEPAATPTQGQTFFYFGRNVTRFAEIFGADGLVVRRFDVGGAS